MNGEKKDFSMPSLYHLRLNNRIEEKELAFGRGDIIGVFRYLRMIFREIYFKLTENDIKEFDELFKKAENFLQNDSPKTYAYNISKAEKVLDEIDIVLNKKMYECNLIFPTEKQLEEVRLGHVGF